MAAGRYALGTLVAVACAVVLGALSRQQIPNTGTPEAALRFSWRLRSEEVGDCRHPTEQEMEALPAHMRNPDACVGQVPDYRLLVRVNGEERFDDRVRASGARGDRPLFVYREIRLRPGTHDLQVRFTPEDGSDAVSLDLDSDLTLGANEVLLVTRNEDTGTLEVVRPRS